MLAREIVDTVKIDRVREKSSLHGRGGSNNKHPLGATMNNYLNRLHLHDAVALPLEKLSNWKFDSQRAVCT